MWEIWMYLCSFFRIQRGELPKPEAPVEDIPVLEAASAAEFEEVNRQQVRIAVMLQGEEEQDAVYIACPDGIGIMDAIEFVDEAYHKGHICAWDQGGTMNSLPIELVSKIVFPFVADDVHLPGGKPLSARPVRPDNGQKIIQLFPDPPSPPTDE